MLLYDAAAPGAPGVHGQQDSLEVCWVLGLMGFRDVVDVVPLDMTGEGNSDVDGEKKLCCDGL